MSDRGHGVWLSAEALILASGSRTRTKLLETAGLYVEMVKPDVDERRIEANSGHLTPIELAILLATAKAEDVAGRYPDRVTVGADQVLEVNGELFHKPVDLQDVKERLSRLQGRTHALHSAVAVVSDGLTEAFYETARLTMRSLSHDAISSYVSHAGTERVTSSVGGYQLEGLGIHLFERIEGDHSTVLGLPLIPLLARLRQMGLLAIP